jgi:hypothetical protein
MEQALRRFANEIEKELLDEWEDLLETVRQLTQEKAPVDTGRLRDSYEDMVEWVKRTVLEGSVSTKVPYAAFQEFIYTPHMGPAFEESKPKIRSHIEAAWNRAVRSVS